MNALKIIRAGSIGEVVRVEAHMGGWGNPGDWWRTSKTISGGILYDWGVHLLEYVLQIIRSDMTEVSGFVKRGFWEKQTKWKKDTNEDEGFVTIRFKNGQWATLCISNINSKPKDGWVEITGTKGTFLFDGSGWTLITHEDAVCIVRKGKNPANEYFRFYKNIASHLTRGEKLVITTEWARRPIHIIDLAQKSAKQGKAFQVKYK
jgi:predicted dehydrogenase